MKRRDVNRWREHKAELAGKHARKLGLTSDHNPYRGRTGFGRALWAAWLDGWKEQDRELWLEAHRPMRPPEKQT